MRKKIKASIKAWFDMRRPKSRSVGVRIFSILFCLTILGGVGYGAWLAWEEIQKSPENPYAQDRVKAQECFDETVNEYQVKGLISDIERESDQTIAQYHFDGFIIALEHDGILNGRGRYPTADVYCTELQEFVESLQPEPEET